MAARPDRDAVVARMKSEPPKTAAAWSADTGVKERTLRTWAKEAGVKLAENPHRPPPPGVSTPPAEKPAAATDARARAPAADLPADDRAQLVAVVRKLMGGLDAWAERFHADAIAARDRKPEPADEVVKPAPALDVKSAAAARSASGVIRDLTDAFPGLMAVVKADGEGDGTTPSDERRRELLDAAAGD